MIEKAWAVLGLVAALLLGFILGTLLFAPNLWCWLIALIQGLIPMVL
jgi:hypothetical protein